MIAKNSTVYSLHEISSQVSVSLMSLTNWRYPHTSVNTFLSTAFSILDIYFKIYNWRPENTSESLLLVKNVRNFSALNDSLFRQLGHWPWWKLKSHSVEIRWFEFTFSYKVKKCIYQIISDTIQKLTPKRVKITQKRSMKYSLVIFVFYRFPKTHDIPLI